VIYHHEGIILQKGFEPLESVSLKQPLPNGAVFRTLAGLMEVTFYAPTIIRLRRITEHSLPDYGILVSQPQPVDVALTEVPNGHRLQYGEVSLDVFNGPLRIRLQRGGKTLLQSVTDRTIEGSLRFNPVAIREQTWMLALALNTDEPVYGLGEKWSALNRRGMRIDSWNEDTNGVNSELSYKNIPFAWSPTGWGLFANTPSRVTHGVGYPQWSHRSYVLQVHDPELDIFLIAAQSPAELLERYTFLTGRTPQPPRWSYGVWMSRAYYRTAEIAMEVAEKMRARSLPFDVLVLDGRSWHKMDVRNDFQWDLERYPDPAGYVKKLRALGVRQHSRVIAITGTNGKTTTTRLAGLLLERSGMKVAVAGNIAPAVLDVSRLDRLEKAGLVARHANPADRRGLLVGLTEQGLALIDGILGPHIANEDALLAGLEQAERQALDRLLAKLLAGLPPPAV